MVIWLTPLPLICPRGLCMTPLLIIVHEKIPIEGQKMDLSFLSLGLKILIKDLA